MKIFNFFLALLLTASFANAQFIKTTLQTNLDDCKPYIGTKQCEKYKLKDGLNSEKESLEQIWLYNIKGQPIFEFWLLESTDTIIRITYEYNNKNQLIRSLEYARDYSLEEMPTEYSYNTKGLLEKSITISFDPTIVVNSYNSKGFIKESKAFQKLPAYDEEGIESAVIEQEIYKNVYKTDKKGRIIEMNYASLLSNYDFKSKTKYTYNDKGQISKYKTSHEDGSVDYEETFSFDKSGKVIASKVIEKGFDGLYKTTYYSFEYK